MYCTRCANVSRASLDETLELWNNMGVDKPLVWIIPRHGRTKNGIELASLDRVELCERERRDKCKATPMNWALGA